MEKRWVHIEEPDAGIVTALSSAINIKPHLARILVQRGISDFNSAKSYFRPALDELHDPFLMKDMALAVDRLAHAIKNNEKILVYGDYDVDGTTSVALFYGFIRNITSNASYYIPDRYSEGYGISAKGIEYARTNGYKLIVSLDCGIKSIELISKAKDYGIEFIVCDHHNPGELPPAFAILDPKRKDCPYPYKELSGCGVGFKLLQGFCRKHSYDEKELINYLDLVAVSIASDIVPMTGENRILTYWGMKILNKNQRPGMKALIDISGFKSDIDIQNVVFGIGPRINAAGRIAHAKSAVDLLLADSEKEAESIAKLVNDNNSLRKDFDLSITEEAISMIQENADTPCKTNVLFSPEWHKGVIGIVASRCIEKYYKPTVILTKSNNFATGSARSIAGFDLYEAICKCSDLLVQFGGHTHAAGLTLEIKNIEAFRKRFEEVAAEVLNDSDLLPIISIDGNLPLKKINKGFYKILNQMAPFGPGNMEPVFVAENVFENGSVKLLKEKHLKLKVQQDDSDSIDAIAFNMPEYYERILNGERFHICYTINENTFNGRTNLQLNIKDIKFIKNQ